jgi:hypothetical protein
MKNQMNAVKIGKTINIQINGQLRKKVCDTHETADEIFKFIMSVKDAPSDQDIKKVFAFLNEKTRIAMKCGLETDPDTGEIYLAGFNTPVPMTLVEVIKDYHENNYPMDAILNFWKLLMLNPDKRVRTSLFDFINTHDFVLTDSGYMVVYKAVAYRDDKKQFGNNILSEFITNSYLHVKKDWQTSPRRYVVYRDLDTLKLHITKTKTAENWDLEEKNVDILGNLNEMFENLEDFTVEEEDAPYTDKWSKTMKIKLGETIHMNRNECDSNPERDCSYGLHVGATSYVERFGNSGDAILVCYVNPAHVVAVPDYDHSKIRVSQYFPFALANYENRKIDIIEQKYFESDFTEYEVSELEKMVAKVQEEELPIVTSGKFEDEQETRSMEELEKIIENRLISITE